MTTTPAPRWLPLAPAARALCAIGILFTIVATAWASSWESFDLGGLVFLSALIGWGTMPYFVLWAISYRVRDPWAQGLAALLLLVFDVWMRIDVLYFSTDALSSLALFVTPVLAVVILLPCGLMAGALCGRVWRKAQPPPAA